MMTIPEILDELEYSASKFPREAVMEAIAQREAITPALLHILEDVTDNLAEIAFQEHYMAHLYAMFLLAQFREARAYPLLVKLITADHKMVDAVLGDCITEDLGQMLASVSHGDSSLLERIVEDATLDEYIRSAALDAMVVLVTQREKTRDEVMGYFQQLFRGKLERENSFVWGDLVCLSCDLYPEEVLVEIEQAFMDGLIDEFIVDMNFVSQTIAAGKERTLAKLEHSNEYGFITDTIAEMESWAFHRAPVTEPTTPIPQPTVTALPAPVRTTPKVGRNEPCPCGSGKKYKRCCG